MELQQVGVHELDRLHLRGLSRIRARGARAVEHRLGSRHERAPALCRDSFEARERVVDGARRPQRGAEEEERGRPFVDRGAPRRRAGCSRGRRRSLAGPILP